MSTPKAKRQSISVDVKLKVIETRDKDPNKSYEKIAKECSTSDTKLSKANVQRILGGKDKTLAARDDGIGAKRAKLKGAKHGDLEKALLMWLKQVRSQNVAVNGPLLKVISTPIHSIYFINQGKGD